MQTIPGGTAGRSEYSSISDSVQCNSKASFVALEVPLPMLIA